MTTNPDSNSKPKRFDLINRGEYGTSPLGVAVFCLVRAVDGFVLQRAFLLANPVPGLLARLGISPPPLPPTGAGTWISSLLNFSRADVANAAVTNTALTPFQSVLYSMAIACAVKQIIWMIYISNEALLPGPSLAVGVFNTINNGLNIAAFSYAAANPTWNPAAMYVAIPVYTAGLLIELVSELQRKWFKDAPENKGKAYSGGLFGLSRNVNYFGYTMWRAGFALAGGGWVFGAAVFAFFVKDFMSRAVPVKEEHCARKYGRQWEEVERKVPYALIPGVL